MEDSWTIHCRARHPGTVVAIKPVISDSQGIEQENSTLLRSVQIQICNPSFGDQPAVKQSQKNIYISREMDHDVECVCTSINYLREDHKIQLLITCISYLMIMIRNRDDD